jgi:hypothetical protein
MVLLIVCVCMHFVTSIFCLNRNIRNEFFLLREHGYCHEDNIYNFNWLPGLLTFLDSEMNRSCKFWLSHVLSGSPVPVLTQELVDQRDMKMLQRWGIWQLNGGPSPDDWARRERISKLKSGGLIFQRDQPSGPFTIVEHSGVYPEPPPPHPASPAKPAPAAHQANPASQAHADPPEPQQGNIGHVTLLDLGDLEDEPDLLEGELGL